MFLTPSNPSTPLTSTNPIIQAIQLLKLALDQSTYKVLSLIALLASEGSGVVSYSVLRGAVAAVTTSHGNDGATYDSYDEDSFILNLDDLLDLQLLSRVDVRNGIYISREVRRFVFDEMGREEFETCWEGLGGWLVGVLESGSAKSREIIGEGKMVVGKSVEKRKKKEESDGGVEGGEFESECEWVKTKDGKWVVKEPEPEVEEEDDNAGENGMKEDFIAQREEYVQCAFALLGAFVEWGKRNGGVGVSGRDRRRGRGVKKLVARLLGILRSSEGVSGNAGKITEVGQGGKGTEVGRGGEKVEGRPNGERGVKAETMVETNREVKKEDTSVESAMIQMETESYGAENSMAKQVAISKVMVSVVECA